MASERVYKQIDLKPYYPFGLPILKLLFGLAAISLALVAIYEFAL